MTKMTFLLKEISTKIDDFKRDSDKHKAMHRRLRGSAYLITGLSSILAGLALYLPDSQTMLNIGILIIGALGGLIASFEGLRKPDELWIHERTTYYSLCDLKREIEFYSQDSLSEAQLDDFFSRFQKLLTNAGEKWSSGIVGTNSGQQKTGPEVG